MRDTKAIEQFIKEKYRKITEMSLFRNLKKKLKQALMELRIILLKKVLIKIK